MDGGSKVIRLIATGSGAAPLLLAVTATAVIAGAQPTERLRRFNERIAAYVELHRRLEADLPRLQVTADVHDIENAVDAMALAMRTARSAAKTGEFFTAEIAEVFRSAIASGLSRANIDVTDLLAAIDEENQPVAMKLTVNERFESGFAMTPAVILDALPSLPEELQYRFVGSTLVLLDIHADLVVDILPNAIPVVRTR
jgi:hypothetical protein